MADAYFPPPESEGGWRFLASDEQVRELAKMDPELLELIEQEQQMLASDGSYGLVIIRNGHLVREYYSFNVATTTRFDVWSCTKSVTGTAWGVALEDSRQDALPGGRRVDLDTPIYDLIPEGHPLSDPRKAGITVGHVLTMTSGIGGERFGAHGSATATGEGSFEFALGRAPNRAGYTPDRLAYEPGSTWDYCDAAFSHLSLALRTAVGREMRDYLGERVLTPIGMEEASWGTQGGAGFIGPHTNAHTAFTCSARELARLGYLMLRRGRWEDDQLVPEWWVDLATRSSQESNPAYGYTWWVNTPGTLWPYLPTDAYAAFGYRSSRCYVVPSLDLVVARVATGPSLWDEAFVMERVAQAIIDG